MNVIERYNLVVNGKGLEPMMFAYGFGCDQNIWRFVSPQFKESHQTILFDHGGIGNSDLTAFDHDKHKTLDVYADDIIDISEELNLKDVILVGHSVSPMMAIIAAKNLRNYLNCSFLKSITMLHNDHDYLVEKG